MASVRTAPRAPERGPIHGSAWKGYSAKLDFRFTALSEARGSPQLRARTINPGNNPYGGCAWQLPSARLPSEVGVKAKAEGGLGKINAEGLKRVGDSYVNDAYGESDVNLNVDVQGGIGAIDLEVV